VKFQKLDGTSLSEGKCDLGQVKIEVVNLEMLLVESVCCNLENPSPVVGATHISESEEIAGTQDEPIHPH